MMKTASLGVFQPSVEITKALKQRLGKMTPKQLKKLDTAINEQVLHTLFILLPELEYMVEDLDGGSEVKTPKIPSQRNDTTQTALQWWQRNEWFNAQGFEQETAAARAFDVLLDLEGYDKDSDEYFHILNKRLRNFFSKHRKIKFDA